MKPPTETDGRLLKFIQAGILIWGVVLAAGVVWYDYDRGGVNLWKPAIIIAGVVIFLAAWSLALSVRSSRPTPPEQS